MILPILLLAGISFQPATPTVGDLVTIQFPEKVVLQPSPAYEVLSSDGQRVVVRTFAPKPFEVRALAAGKPVQITIPVKSVLARGDLMTPAPLTPPRPAPYPKAPFVAIGAAALVAALTWLMIWLQARRKREPPVVPAESAEERFRAAIARLRAGGSWQQLADETRRYLVATRPVVTSDLTTTELVPRLRDEERFVAHILRQGDLEKFSTRKPDPADFDEAARRALELAS